MGCASSTLPVTAVPPQCDGLESSGWRPFRRSLRPAPHSTVLAAATPTPSGPDHLIKTYSPPPRRTPPVLPMFSPRNVQASQQPPQLSSGPAPPARRLTSSPAQLRHRFPVTHDVLAATAPCGLPNPLSPPSDPTSPAPTPPATDGTLSCAGKPGSHHTQLPCSPLDKEALSPEGSRTTLGAVCDSTRDCYSPCSRVAYGSLGSL